MSGTERDEARLAMARRFVNSVPQNLALGIQAISFAQGEAVFELPYDLKLVGNPDTGVLHGGAITTLLDGASGAAVMAALVKIRTIATLDLRIDYLRAAEPGRAVRCRATCYKLTHNVAFTRAAAFHANEADPIAAAVGTFMLGTKPGSLPRDGAITGAER